MVNIKYHNLNLDLPTFLKVQSQENENSSNENFSKEVANVECHNPDLPSHLDVKSTDIETESNTYNEFIDNALKTEEEAIMKEGKLIGQSSYFLSNSGSKWLNIGLGPSAGFIPIIQIKSVSTCISFTANEWEEFRRTDGCSPNHRIEFSQYKDITVIKLKSRKQQLVLSTDIQQPF